MGAWDDYKREEGHGVAKAGKFRCVIVSAEETVSKTSGKDMIVITVRPSGSKANVKYFLVHNQYFNRNATQFFDAFPAIGDGNFNTVEWVGAMGAADFKVGDRGYLEVGYFLSPERAADLPDFEGEKPEKVEVVSLMPDDDDDDLPFC